MSATLLTLPRERSAIASYLDSLVKWESVLFAAICLLDMVTTLYWVHHGQATEANPVLAPALLEGDFQFCALKLISFIPMLLLCAWYRLKQPRFIEIAMRMGIAAYIAIYAAAVGSQFIK